MKYRRFGKTGLNISEIGYGAWGIGGAMWRGATDHESLKALNLSIDKGLNFIDTALAYCLSPKAVTTVIPGMRSSKHVEANCLASGKPELSEKILEQLGEQRWIRNFYPAV